jgi:hypothetical protein
MEVNLGERQVDLEWSLTRLLSQIARLSRRADVGPKAFKVNEHGRPPLARARPAGECGT